MRLEFPERLLRSLSRARSVAAFTGAGVSAESGVPTFRGADGIWAKFNPAELANIDAFMKNPALVWEWYRQRKHIIASVSPNPGHIALARMETVFPVFAVITQNIDILHRRAGSRIVHELHGNIERSYCMTCGSPCTDEAELSSGDIPRCARPECGGIMRPDVVWFGELLPDDEWKNAMHAAESADVFLSIGTSGVVYPAASIPLAAKQHGAFLVEINPEPTPLTDRADEFLRGKSGEVLPALLESVMPLRHTGIERLLGGD